jgi:hypothetical protein
MTARETVNKGLQDRRDVRAAEAARDMAWERAHAVNDARIRERCNNATAIRKLEIEADAMRRSWEEKVAENRHLSAELAACRKREAERHQRARIVNAAKATVTALLLTFARDLDLMAPWLVTTLLVISVSYVVYAIVRLAREK